MTRSWARAWAASCSRVPRTSCGGAAQPFAADHDFGVLLSGDVPPAGGVMAEPGLLAFGSAGDDDDGRGDFRVPAADLQPDVFQDLEQAAGGLGAVAAAGPVPGVCALTGPGVPGPLIISAGGGMPGA